MAIVNIGTVANDGTGDKLRDAFDKVNKEFDKTIKRESDGIIITGVDGVKAEGFKVLKSDGTVLGYLGEHSTDEHTFGIYSGSSFFQFTAAGAISVSTNSSKTIEVHTKQININHKKVLTEADLPTMPKADGEYKLKVASGVATWISI